jgi:hypothetical protein
MSRFTDLFQDKKPEVVVPAEPTPEVKAVEPQKVVPISKAKSGEGGLTPPFFSAIVERQLTRQ